MTRASQQYLDRVWEVAVALARVGAVVGSRNGGKSMRAFKGPGQIDDLRHERICMFAAQRSKAGKQASKMTGARRTAGQHDPSPIRAAAAQQSTDAIAGVSINSTVNVNSLGAIREWSTSVDLMPGGMMELVGERGRWEVDRYNTLQNRVSAALRGAGQSRDLVSAVDGGQLVDGGRIIGKTYDRNTFSSIDPANMPNRPHMASPPTRPPPSPPPSFSIITLFALRTRCPSATLIGPDPSRAPGQEAPALHHCSSCR
ncbi:hypothetical protein Q7P37_004642 [Cladosporium fusiforme]